MTYREDLRLLVERIPEEVQGDDTYFAAQRLLALVEQAEEDEPAVTVEGVTYYTVPSTGEVICPECGRTRSPERISDHMASEHDGEEDGDFLTQGGLFIPADLNDDGFGTGGVTVTTLGEDTVNHDTVAEQTGEDR